MTFGELREKYPYITENNLDIFLATKGRDEILDAISDAYYCMSSSEPIPRTMVYQFFNALAGKCDSLNIRDQMTERLDKIDVYIDMLRSGSNDHV
jgi:hypothetical protein